MIENLSWVFIIDDHDDSNDHLPGCEDGPNQICQARNLLQGVCLQGNFQISKYLSAR